MKNILKNITLTLLFSLLTGLPLSLHSQTFDPSLIDSDGDGVMDDKDNCQNSSNAAQTDTDGDADGDVCDSDDDGDDTEDASDAHPLDSSLQ